MRVLLKLRATEAAYAAAAAGASGHVLAASIEHDVPGLRVDEGYPVVQLPSVRPVTGAFYSLSQPLAFSSAPEDSTYLVRAAISDTDAQAWVEAAMHPEVTGVFADPVIETWEPCDGAAVGTDMDVAQLLATDDLRARGMDGAGVRVALVDTGVNLSYLQTRGRQHSLLTSDSWTPAGVSSMPGDHPLNHGTMCAYQIGIAAPQAALLDCAVLHSPAASTPAVVGVLSDALLAYSKLLQGLMLQPPDARALVISNSWGMSSAANDFPPGHPGNYSDNPGHPFNVLVATLENAGADILFAAGNCGRDCPDHRCGFGASPPICGANSHPDVLCVAGVDVTKARAGYSSQGPGRLDREKPDLAAYTHFVGSGVYPVDAGTSTACPVAAGVIAAVRT